MYVYVHKYYIYFHTRAEIYPVEVTTVLYKELGTLLASMYRIGWLEKGLENVFLFLKH